MTPERHPRQCARRSAYAQPPPAPSRTLMLVSDEARESASGRLARAYTAGRIDGGGSSPTRRSRLTAGFVQRPKKSGDAGNRTRVRSRV